MEIIVKALLAVLFIVSVAWYIHFQFTRKRLYKLAAQFNGPHPLPFIGNILKCLVPPKEITDAILEGSLRYQSPVRLWFGPKLFIYIWDPENIKIVLNSTSALEKEPYIYKLLEDISGPGILTLPVDQWKRHRKLIAPMFNQKYLDVFFEIFHHHAQELIVKVEQKANNKIFDVHYYLQDYATSTIMDTILDCNGYNVNSNISYVVGRWIETITGILIKRSTNILYFFDCIFNITPIGQEATKGRKKYDDFMSTIIKQWEETSKSEHTKDSDVDNVTDWSKPKKFIEHLFSISDGSGKFTFDELQAEIKTIIAAGSETTSSTIGYTLLALGTYPNIQEKLYQEIQQVLGTRKQLTNEDLKKLEYLERVIKEVLRIYPAISGLARNTDQEIQLKNHTIPAHSTVVVGLLSLHRDPNIWPNPNDFDPDRFLPEEEAKRHPYSYIPFSAGARNCIGIRFAWMSLKIVLASFILKYKVRTNYKNLEDIRLTMMVSFRPIDGYKVALVPR